MRKYLCRHAKDNQMNHGRNLQAGNCAKECQLNWEKPLEVKDNTYKLSETNDVSTKHSYFPPQ